MSRALIILFILAALLPLASRIFSSYFYLFTPAELPNSYFKLNDKIGSCRVLKEQDDRLRYCEDATRWEDASGKIIGLLITCDPGRKSWNTVMGPLRDPEPRGNIWFLDTLLESVQRLSLDSLLELHAFHPLGVAVHPAAPSAPAVLSVVNHGRMNSTIELFTLTPPTLRSSPKETYQRNLTHPGLVSPNAIYPITSTSLLVSRDHTFTRRLPYPFSPILPVMESILTLPHSRVDLVDFARDTIQVTTAVRAVAFANGIAISPKGDELAVASSSGPTIRFFRISCKIDRSMLPLAAMETIKMPFTPVNLHWSSDGSLCAAVHAGFLALILMSQEAELYPHQVGSSPYHLEEISRVDSAPFPINKRVASPKNRSLTTVYQGDGSADGFGSSTTAIVEAQNGVMWMIGFYERGILQCRV